MRRPVYAVIIFAVVGIVAALTVAGLRGARDAKSILAAYRPDAHYGSLHIRYPLEGTLFPPDIAAPTLRWSDPARHADAWVLRIQFANSGKPLSFVTEQPAWTPGEADWAAIKRRSQEQVARVTILGVRRGVRASILSAGEVTFSTSRDPVGAPILYREVILPFAEAVKDPSKIRWRMGTVDAVTQPPVVLDKLPVCGNCHSFSADGKTLGMDVDYANDKGSYAIAPVTPEMTLDRRKIITWSDYRRDDGELTFGLLSQVSPDGRYVVSTVKDRSIFIVRDDPAYSQLFFPIKGILAIYDRESKTFRALPGADDKRSVQSNPCWSPDGRAVVFARAEAHDLTRLQHPESALLTSAEADEFFQAHEKICYDLYRVPFNNGKGGKATPLPGASGNGMSNFFPKYSPDGKWIVFCQARSFMLLQPDSTLYIMPAAGGAPRRMRCNTGKMNSWHSWSPNGRWLVFASKANGPYTQLFLTHIDEQGNDSPAVVLSRFTAPDRAANIPEFANLAPGAIAHIRERFLDDLSYVRSGTDLFNAGDNARAEAAFRQAIEVNPKNAVAHFCLGNALATQDQVADARVEFQEAATLDPANAEYRYALGKTLRQLGQGKEAVAAYREALRLHPTHAQARADLGKALCEQGNVAEGIRLLEEAVQAAPHDFTVRYSLAAACYLAGDADRAIAEATKAMEQAQAAGKAAQTEEIRQAIARFRTHAHD